jgi:hypothetical protein
MRYENKFWNRVGSKFINQNTTVDLANLKYLHCGVDTIKQLFNCIIRSSVLEKVKQAYEGSAQYLTVKDTDWLITRSSKSSGYQYILKNLDLGVVVLLKSFYAEEDLSGSHLKIECTPQLIAQHSPQSLTDYLFEIANLFCVQVVPCGVACHIAVDVKGFEVPTDLESRLVAKAKRQYKFNSISNAQLDLNETAVIYGAGQSYTFGSAGALQFCIYDKTAEAIKSDKLDFWRSVWSRVPASDFDGDFSNTADMSEYSEIDTVHRIEARFHHSVINQFCWGTKDHSGKQLEIKTFEDLAPHLTALWRYSLNNFRLQYSTSYIDPVWQALIEDIEFFCPMPNIDYKRSPKPPSQNTRRNVAFWLGNQIRLYARKRYTPEYVVSRLMNSGLEAELADYFSVRMFGENDLLVDVLYDFVSEKMRVLWLSGVAA